MRRSLQLLPVLVGLLLGAGLTMPAAGAAPARSVPGYVPLAHPYLEAVSGPGITHNTAVSPAATTAQLINGNSDKCLEVYNSSTSNGAKVDQWNCNNTATQNWHFVRVGTTQNEAVDEIVNNNSGKCLEVYHSSTAEGAKVDQWTCNGSATQHWQYHDPHTGIGVLLLNMNSGLILEVAKSSTANGAAVDQWLINYTNTQHWFRGEVV